MIPPHRKWWHFQLPFANGCFGLPLRAEIDERAASAHTFAPKREFGREVDRQLLGINLHHNAGSPVLMRDHGRMHAQRWRTSTSSSERRR